VSGRFTVWAETTAVSQRGSANSVGQPCCLCRKPFAAGERLYRTIETGDDYVCSDHGIDQR